MNPNYIDSILTANLYLIFCKMIGCKKRSDVARGILNQRIKKVLNQRKNSTPLN